MEIIKLSINKDKIRTRILEKEIEDLKEEVERQNKIIEELIYRLILEGKDWNGNLFRNNLWNHIIQNFGGIDKMDKMNKMEEIKNKMDKMKKLEILINKCFIGFFALAQLYLLYNLVEVWGILNTVWLIGNTFFIFINFCQLKILEEKKKWVKKKLWGIYLTLICCIVTDISQRTVIICIIQSFN